MNLVSVLHQLYASEIEVSISARWDEGWQLEIEDGKGGKAAASGFVRTIDDAAAWFHEQALIHFPESQYAESAGAQFREAVPADVTMRRLSGL